MAMPESPRASSTAWRSDPLGVPLQVSVDGGEQVRAVDRRDHGVLPQREPVAAPDLVARRPVGAVQLGVEGALEAGQRLLGPHRPDQVGRDVLGRVLPHRVAPGADALEPRLVHGRHHVAGQGRGDPAGDVLEAAVLDPEPLEGGEVVDVQPLGQEPGELGGPVPGHLRVGDDHPAGHRVGQRLPVAVQDVAALGRQHHVDDALGRRHRGVRARVDPLELDEPGAEDREHHRDEDEADPQSEQREIRGGAAGSRLAGSSHEVSPVRFGTGAGRASVSHSYRRRGRGGRCSRTCRGHGSRPAGCPPAAGSP